MLLGSAEELAEVKTHLLKILHTINKNHGFAKQRKKPVNLHYRTSILIVESTMDTVSSAIDNR